MGRSYLRGQIDCTHRTRPAGNAFRSGQFHRTCYTGGMGSRMLCSSYVCSNCRRNIVCRDNWLLCALVVRISCKACLDNRLLCALAVRISCKMCTRARNVRRCCSEGRYDEGTPCFFDGVLHLCILCNNWGILDIRLRDLRSYSDCKPSRRGREMQNGTNQLAWSRQTRNGKHPLLR